MHKQNPEELLEVFGVLLLLRCVFFEVEELKYFFKLIEEHLHELKLVNHCLQFLLRLTVDDVIV